MGSYLGDAKRIFGANLINTATGLGVQACLAWFLLPQGRGEYATCIVFASLLMLTCTLGQEMANVYFIGARKIDISQAMSQSVIIGTTGSVVACAIGFGITLTSVPFLEKAPLALFRLSLICIPAMIFRTYLTQIFLGMRAIATFAVMTASSRAIALLGLLIAYWIHLDVATAILIYAFSEGVIAIAAGAVLVVRYKARLVPPPKAQLLRSLGYGARFYFGKLASAANVQMGTIILSMSPVAVAEIGLFAAASTLAARLWIIADSLQTALLPRTTADPEGRSEAVAQCLRVCLAITAIGAIVVFVLAKPIIGIVLSREFLPVLLPMLMLLPGIVARVVLKVLSAYFAGIGRPGITSTAVAVSVTVNLTLAILILPVWGLVGVAFAMTISYTLEALIMCGAFMRFSGLTLRRTLILTRADIDTLCRMARSRLSSGPHERRTTSA